MRLFYDREAGQWQLSLSEDAFIHPINHWHEWLHPRRYNWLTFRPFWMEFEWDKAVPGWEVTLVLLGLGLRLRVNREWEGTDWGESLKEAEEAIEAQRTYDMDTVWCPTCRADMPDLNDDLFENRTLPSGLAVQLHLYTATCQRCGHVAAHASVRTA